MRNNRFLLPLILCAVVLGGAFLVFKDGAASLLSYAFFLLCPLMHFLMMHGHSHGGHRQHNDCHADKQSDAEKPAQQESGSAEPGVL